MCEAPFCAGGSFRMLLLRRTVVRIKEIVRTTKVLHPSPKIRRIFEPLVHALSGTRHVPNLRQQIRDVLIEPKGSADPCFRYADTFMLQKTEVVLSYPTILFD